MLLDEPEHFLGSEISNLSLCTLLKKLAAEQKNRRADGASHDLNLAATLADRIILLKDGAASCATAFLTLFSSA